MHHLSVQWNNYNCIVYNKLGPLTNASGCNSVLLTLPACSSQKKAVYQETPNVASLKVPNDWALFEGFHYRVKIKVNEGHTNRESAWWVCDKIPVGQLRHSYIKYLDTCAHPQHICVCSKHVSSSKGGKPRWLLAMVDGTTHCYGRWPLVDQAPESCKLFLRHFFTFPAAWVRVRWDWRKGKRWRDRKSVV